MIGHFAGGGGCGGPDLLDEGQGQHGQAADQVAEGEEAGLLEVAVGKLAAEDPGGDGGDGEGVQDPGGLRAAEAQVFGEVEAQERQPGAPDHELEEHHDGEPGTYG